VYDDGSCRHFHSDGNAEAGNRKALRPSQRLSDFSILERLETALEASRNPLQKSLRRVHLRLRAVCGLQIVAVAPASCCVLRTTAYPFTHHSLAV
jgi:hypothetical protein